MQDSKNYLADLKNKLTQEQTNPATASDRTSAQSFLPAEFLGSDDMLSDAETNVNRNDSDIAYGTDRIDALRNGLEYEGNGDIDHLQGSTGAETLSTDAEGDVLADNSDNDQSNGEHGNDHLFGETGENLLGGGLENGDQGCDTAMFDGSNEEFTVVDLGSGEFQVSTGEEIDHEKRVEDYQFTDQPLSAEQLANDQPTPYSLSLIHI